MTTGRLYLAAPEVGLAVKGEVATAVVQVVLSSTAVAAGAVAVGAGMTRIARAAAGTVAFGIAVVVAVSSTRLHGAPSRHKKNMHQWLSCKNPSGTSDTLGKLGTLDRLHCTDPRSGMTVSAEETSGPILPRQHKLSLHHESFASMVVGPTNLEFGASITYC